MVIAHPSGGSVKGLLDLPAELCLRIFDFLPDQASADLAALARTCKTLWWPAVRALYKRIILNPKVVRRKHRRKKPASFLRLFHALLLCDKDFLSMTDEIRIEIKDPTFLCDILLYASADAEEFSELESLGTDISMQISQDMAAAEPADIMLDWREITELILQRSSNLRYIDIFGYTDHTNWDFQLHRHQKLEIIYLHSPRVLTLQGLADLALIPNLQSLQLSSMRDGWHYGPFRFSSIPQAQFPSLVHLKILGFPATATYTPDLITMVPMLRSLEIQWVGGCEAVEAFAPYATLSSILSGAHRSTTRPKPRLGETLEKMRVHEIWSRNGVGRIRSPNEIKLHEEENVKMWNESFFGSLKFLRSLELLEIPLLAPVHRIIHLLPESLEELHLTDENLFLFDLAEEFERISAILPQLGPTAGLHNMKAVFLKFHRLDPSPCQHIMDRMKDICQEAGIKLNVVLNYVPESEWGLKEN